MQRWCVAVAGSWDDGGLETFVVCVLADGADAAGMTAIIMVTAEGRCFDNIEAIMAVQSDNIVGKVDIDTTG